MHDLSFSVSNNYLPTTYEITKVIAWRSFSCKCKKMYADFLIVKVHIVYANGGMDFFYYTFPSQVRSSNILSLQCAHLD